MLRFLNGALALSLLSSTALAGEVVWFGEPTPAQRVAVAEQAAPQGPDLTVFDLATGATAFSDADLAALQGLEAALEEVRPYESRLDGELVIMRDLSRPIDGISVLRDEADRDVLFKALTYQGFAVDRYFMQALATDDAAAEYRLDVDGTVVERPWADAIALDSERTISAYDIAEAPQRVAFGEVQRELARALPASLVPWGLGDDDTLVVDGVARDIGPTGSVRLPMGRHFVHVQRDGVITQRWMVRLQAGEEQVVTVQDPVPAVQSWLDAVWAGDSDAVPDAVQTAVSALGGDVWLARPGNRGVDVVRVTADGVQRQQVLPVTTRRSSDSGVTAYGSVHGGWLSSGNFSLDKAGAEFSRSEVNALNLGAGVGMAYTKGWLRIGGGLQLAYTPGADHVARYASGQTHLRLYPHIAVGLPQLQLTLGYALPMHPTAGLRSEIAIAKGLELQATAWLGLGGERTRDGVDPYDLQPLYAATVGVGYRFGL